MTSDEIQPEEKEFPELPQTVTVECPQCGGFFEAAETEAMQSFQCQVCHHAWAELIIRQVKSFGISAYMGRARREHWNLNSKARWYSVFLRSVLGYMDRIFVPIPCATKTCNGKLTRLNPYLLQILSDGWPTTGRPPILCLDCYKTAIAAKG